MLSWTAVEALNLTSGRELRAWLNGGLDAARRDAGEMTSRPRDAWPEWIEGHPHALTYQFANAILDASVAARDRDPAEAVALTGLLIERVERIPVPDAILRGGLESRIWIEHGNALLLIEDAAGALDAFHYAQAVATSSPSLPLFAAMARRGAAYARHKMGHSEEALRIIREDIPVFEAHHALGDVLRSRFFEATIEYERDHFEPARRMFSSALALAERQRDDRMLARLYNNLGHCERQLGHRDAALSYLLQALVSFDRLGMTGEPFRAQWGIDLLRADEGAVTSAITALRALIDKLIAEDRMMEAARVALDVVELLVLSERHEHVKKLASELVSVFDRANMPREKLRAFAALRAATAERVLTREDTRATRAELRVAVGDPP